ncbi:MAG: nuclear transport factor 2 family protein [Pyrinomonadaceae bacterium]
MKKMMTAILIAIAALSFAFGQTKMSNDAKVEAQVIALEKAGWEAWKNKDGSWTRDNVTEEFLLVNSDGVSSKTQVVKSTATDCEVKSYSLDKFQFVTLDKDSVLMTYTAMQDGVCSGKPIPANVRASVVYVKRAGKWLEALYMETPTAQ